MLVVINKHLMPLTKELEVLNRRKIRRRKQHYAKNLKTKMSKTTPKAKPSHCNAVNAPS
jgi:hypothetical protein